MKKLNIGDIFSIPVDKERGGFGQIIDIPDKQSIVVIIFEKIYKLAELPELKEIINDNIIFFSTTFDAKFYHNDWKIVGRLITNINSIPCPYYKLGVSLEDARVENFKGQVIRNASQHEFESLNYRLIVAPVRLENAFKAYHKLVPWSENYDKVKFSNVIQSIQLIEGFH